MPSETETTTHQGPCFYLFSQNNSGGDWDLSHQNLGIYTYIEANSEEEAISRAEEAGMYFDGVSKGVDCDCCGDRWKRECEKIKPKTNYFDDSYKDALERIVLELAERDLGVGQKSTVVYLDGQVTTYTCKSIFKADTTHHSI